MKKILIIEPTLANTIHFPFNCGIVQTIAQAFPSAEIIFLGERQQGEMILAELQNDLLDRIRVITWKVYKDRDTLPTNIIKRAFYLIQSAFFDLMNADMIVFASASGPCISALRALPRRKSQKLQIFMHGDYNELLGWRSKNPFRKFADLYSSLKKASAAGAQIMVLEEHIQSKTCQDLPEFLDSFHYFPHPRVQREILQSRKYLSNPINIGLAGGASVDKGISQLLELSKIISLTDNRNRFRFHAIGAEHPSSKTENFSRFETKPANQQIERSEFLNLLDRMHFLFFWPTGTYYDNASSGALHDAINRKIPIIASSRVIKMFPEVAAFSITADCPSQIAETLYKLTPEEYQNLQLSIFEYEKRYNLNELAQRYRTITSNSLKSSNLEIKPTQQV
ncbi:hypothetical protein [Noviherbaspirillum pedocola]|uniref:Uncharacterized protein n=1 Tax=Noviherbaspirillum pedocola TaxID=2801341 RepID=A0A934SPF7_9BURK|nr:hypothetical protein [Noviherbaspirillum pedocola]MBK4734296.1 hypothetical protein [Noviherbaspirillum pedocola]